MSNTETITTASPVGLRIIGQDQRLDNVMITYNFCCSRCLANLSEQLDAGNGLNLLVSGMCAGVDSAGVTNIYYLSCSHGHPLFVRTMAYPLFFVTQGTYDSVSKMVRTTAPTDIRYSNDIGNPARFRFRSRLKAKVSLWLLIRNLHDESVQNFSFSAHSTRRG